jgi:hypothetical protein
MMDKRLQSLMDKYWEGNTTLSEEKELRDFFESAEGYAEEKAFFKSLNHLKTNILPTKKKSYTILNWRLYPRIAAGIILFVGALFLFQNQKRQAEKEAFMEVMQAFEMVNEQMRKGTDSMKSMEEFRHLKITKEI